MRHLLTLTRMAIFRKSKGNMLQGHGEKETLVLLGSEPAATSLWKFQKN